MKSIKYYVIDCFKAQYFFVVGDYNKKYFKYNSFFAIIKNAKAQ